MTATPTPRSLLGLYRAGGTLDVDHKGGDHFLFLPEPDVVPESCVATVIDGIAKRHGCKFGGNAIWHGHMKPFDRRWGDGLRCDIYCGGRGEGNKGFPSHGVGFRAGYLMRDCAKLALLRAHGIDIRGALGSLCMAPFDGTHAMAFDSPHVERQLGAQYGEDFLTPKASSREAKGLKLLGGLQDPTKGVRQDERLTVLLHGRSLI